MSTRLYDAFDLPDWLGTEPVTWHGLEALDSGRHITGVMRGPDGRSHPFDLLAVDSAYPTVVCSDAERHDAHQAWQFGEIILLLVGERVAAAVPASRFDANLGCEAIRRVAKSVGADSSRFSVSLSL